MVPGCSLVSRELFEITDGRKFVHALAMHTSAEEENPAARMASRL